MAKIVHSDAAPSEKVRYSFAGVDFELGGKSSSFESNDPEVLGNAETHPWLTVERDAGEVVHGEYRDYLDPKDDALSAVNSVANDPDAARAALPSAQDDEAQPAAIEAGRDQGEKVEVGGVSETVAADLAATDTGEDN
jgi:hypothetical protein